MRKTSPAPGDCWYCWAPIREHTPEKRQKCAAAIKRYRREFRVAGDQRRR